MKTISILLAALIIALQSINFSELKANNDSTPDKHLVQSSQHVEQNSDQPSPFKMANQDASQFSDVIQSSNLIQSSNVIQSSNFIQSSNILQSSSTQTKTPLGQLSNSDPQQSVQTDFLDASIPIVSKVEATTETIENTTQTFALSFDEQIQHWITQLADTSEFETWKNADWEKYPLGPGTHGWVVLVYNSDQEVGYLIVSSDENGNLQLSEYGTGDNPLFSLKVLYRTMILHELMPASADYAHFIDDHGFTLKRIYFNAFESVWELYSEEKVYYFDAVTGEAYPLTAEIIKSFEEQKLLNGQFLHDPILNSTPSNLTANKLLPIFDPFEVITWVSNEPLQIKNISDLISVISKEKDAIEITYAASIFNDIILVPLAIAGYHEWDNEITFIALEHESLRFVPFPMLQSYGQYFIK